MFKIEKKYLKNKSWSQIYKSANNDSKTVAKFLKMAVEHKNIEGADLDTILEQLNRHTKSHIELTSSGINFV